MMTLTEMLISVVFDLRNNKLNKAIKENDTYKVTGYYIKNDIRIDIKMKEK